MNHLLALTVCAAALLAVPRGQAASVAGGEPAAIGSEAAVEPAGSLASPVPGPVSGERTMEGHLIRCRNSAAMRALPAREEEAWQRLFQFYENRQFQRAWFDGAAPRPLARALSQRLFAAREDGLRPEDYDAGGLARQLDRAAVAPLGERELDALETGLTLAFMNYAGHLLRGRTRPAGDNLVLFAQPRQADLAAVLETAVGQNALAPALASLDPPYEEFRRLRAALARYRELAEGGGWPLVPDGPTVKPGGAAAAGRLATLRERLRIEGFLAGNPPASKPAAGRSASAAYNRDLPDAVKRFQAARGLQAGGLLGPETVAALNVSAAERARQIEVNLERWRWLPAQPAEAWIRVNSGGYRLDVIEQGRTALSMKVIVGQPDWSTPQFCDDITSIILNPTWHVPAKIAADEIVPLARKDPSYLAKNGYEVVDTRSGAVVAPGSIAWSAVAAGRNPYGFRQRPGGWNALGRVKFVFPNSLSIYLHGTPSVHLFQRAGRHLSHGCIRVEQPVDLAAFLLRGDPAWPRQAIVKTINSGGQRTIKLPRPVPAAVIYWTAMADGDAITFMPDVYGLDGKLSEALTAAGRDSSERPQNPLALSNPNY